VKSRIKAAVCGVIAALLASRLVLAIWPGFRDA
jgi:hypothetical protein